ncbi:MAG: tripartite tricarboxylate transporter substrate-binding protein, partial [Cohaesibacter sp.]|nr:tripartite tricarboxylate transporter substrate-binding protein [Cohaesibacter sp.]
PADGYTLIDGYVAPLVLQPLLGNADWTHKDFIPLHAATANAFAIVSRRDETRWKDLDGLIDYMKKNPGKLRYSTGSRGNLPHMVLAKVMQSADVVARNVPYNKNGDAIKDLHGGVLDFMFHNPGHYKANKEKSKPLAVLSDNADASAIYDGAPLVGDLGYDIGLKGLSPTGWNWWLVRKDTPPEVVAKLRDAMAKTLARDDVRQKILNVGFVPTGYTSDQYDDVISKVRDDLSSAIDALQWEKDKLKSVR